VLVRFGRHDKDDRNDRGFGMAEIVVAMTLLGTLLTASVGLLVRTTSVAGQNVRRTTAANLLSRQLETARGTALDDLPEGTTSTTSAVGGTTYSIAQEVRYVSSSDGTSLCDGSSGSLLYKLVTVRITWPDMEAVAPVRGDVLRAVGVGVQGSDASTGALAILVKDSAGNSVGNITVTLRPGGASKRTDSAGCVVFVDLTPGTYAGDAASDDNQLTGSSGGRAVTPGGVAQDTITVYAPPPPPPPPPPTTPPPPPTTPPTTTTPPVTTTPPPTTGTGTPTTSTTTTSATPTVTDTAPAPTTTPPPPPPPPTTSTTTTPPPPPVTTTTTTPPPPPPTPTPTHPRQAS
jgi:type II secretory pathway pseudopilin PulG